MQSLKASHLYKKDVDYIIKDKEVVIIDEFTGRMMEGRRYSEGLHQAIEAKENGSLNAQSKDYTEPLMNLNTLLETSGTRDTKRKRMGYWMLAAS